MAGRPRLRALADAVGIVSSYVDGLGKQRIAGDRVRTRILRGMGFDPGSEAAASRALVRLIQGRRARLLPAVRVVRTGVAAGQRTVVAAGNPAARVEWRLELRAEDGSVHVAEGQGRPGRTGLSLRHPRALPPGYHRLRLELGGTEADQAVVEQAFIVAPRHCVRPADLGAEQTVGVWSNLYSVRSARNQGVGDLGDLRRLIDGFGRAGADFLGVNPLHALRNSARECSPYSPISRLYRNVLYLDLEAIPELEHCPALRRKLAGPSLRRRLDRLRAADQVDYPAVRELKESFFKPLHAEFGRRHGATRTARGRAYRRYLEEQGPALEGFATFLALEQRHRELGRWRSWPADHRDPDSRAVAEFRRQNEREIDLHRYLQFELDRQLEAAARAGKRRGMKVGLYQDLAIGSVADGSECWLHPDLFAHGISLGAPPDGFSRTGQVWQLTPMNPMRLVERCYADWIHLLRNALRHAGALRIDHVIGMVRQFWVPEDLPGSQGTLVAFPADDLFGILALESQRHAALIVGEDLGTVPPELPALLDRWGVLSSRVFLFDQDVTRSKRRSLLTTTTHDHVPLAGFLRGDDLPVLHRLGIVRSESARRRAERDRRRLRRQLIEQLSRRGLLADHEAEPGDRQLITAIHAWLARSRPDLLALSLDDLGLETTPVNIPGTSQEQYHCWKRKMTRSVEELLGELKRVGKGEGSLRSRLAEGEVRLPG